MPLATLTINVQVNAQNAALQFNNLSNTVNNFGTAFQGVSRSVIATGTAMGHALYDAFKGTISLLGGLIQSAIKHSANLNNALTSLSGVANHFGISTKTATDAAKALSADGLLPLRDAAKGLQNLLMTGFSMDQSIKMMNVFKDSASFARQEMYSYGDSIRTATEGLRNSRSVQVDNVGITKNLSQIMKEQGYQLQDISDKTKGASARQVLFNGLMREAAAQSGDAARLLKTYTGATVAVDTAWISLMATVGDAIVRNESVAIAVTYVGQALRDLTAWLATSDRGFHIVTDTLAFVIRALASTIEAVDWVQRSFAKLDSELSTAVRNIIQSVQELAEILLKTAALAAKLPGGTALLGVGFGDELVALIQTVKTTKRVQAEMNAEMAVTAARSEAITATLKPAVASLRGLADAVEKAKGLKIEIGEKPKGAESIEEMLERINKKGKENIDTYRELAAAIKKTTSDQGGFGAAIGKIIQQLPAFEKGMENTRDAMFGFKEIKAAYEVVEALGDVANVSKLTADQQKKVNQIVSDALDVYAKLGITGDRALTDLYNATTKLVGLEHTIKQMSISDMFNPNDIKRWTAEAKIASEFFVGFEALIPQVEFNKMFGDPKEARMWAGLVRGEITAELEKLEQDVTHVFTDIFSELPDIIRNVLSGGGGIGDIMIGVAGMAAQQFNDAFADHLAAAQKAGRGLTGKEKALGIAGAGLEAFLGGYGIGASQGKVKGALGGAASGALTGAAMGTMIMPGIGTAVGAVAGGVVGLVGGLFGGAKKAKEERKQLAEMKQALLEQYGGMENLTKMADKLGISMTAAFNAKKPEQFQRAVDKLNKAIEEQKKRMDALNKAVDGVNTRAEIFADKFTKIYEATQAEGEGTEAVEARLAATAKLQATAQASEAEFARLGLMVRDTFAGLVKETGSGIGAMLQMAPAFQTLEDGVSKFGITSTAVIDELLTNFRLVNDAALKPLFEQIASSGEVLRGLFDAKALSPEGFQAIAADIGLSIQAIVDKGGDMARTLALSQPVLQTLWEAQQQYGQVTDETTQAILDQAEQQGLVGEHMKGVNEKILDVLLAIGKVLNADLPQYFDALKKPADDAARGIEDSFSGIRIDPITIPYNFEAQNAPAGAEVPHLAAGGIVRRPTLALIGEHGPEAVVPLSGSAIGIGPSNYETNIYLDGDRIARSTAKRMPGVLRGVGVGG